MSHPASVWYWRNFLLKTKEQNAKKTQASQTHTKKKQQNPAASVICCDPDLAEFPFASLQPTSIITGIVFAGSKPAPDAARFFLMTVPPESMDGDGETVKRWKLRPRQTVYKSWVNQKVGWKIGNTKHCSDMFFLVAGMKPPKKKSLNLELRCVSTSMCERLFEIPPIEQASFWKPKPSQNSKSSKISKKLSFPQIFPDIPFNHPFLSFHPGENSRTQESSLPMGIPIPQTPRSPRPRIRPPSENTSESKWI